MTPVSVAVLGCSGRMGRMLLTAVAESDAAVLGAATERSGAEWIGRDLGDFDASGVVVTDDPAAALAAVDVAIDFTTPAASVAHARAAAAAGVGHVIGTTGFDDAEIAALDAAAAQSAQVRAGNMSLGVNLLTLLTETVAKALGPAFDIEIVEAHHNRKVDAPSGTALMLGEAAAAGRGVDLAAQSDRGRDGITGARETGRIGFSAIRGGDVVGEHDVIFAGPGERIVLRHLASDRMLFARGAVTAALWTRGRAPGRYDMIDVLGLRTDGDQAGAR